MRRSAVPVLALAVAIAGCEDRPSPRERLARAPEATAAERSAAFSLDMRMRLGEPDAGMLFTASGEGVYDLDAGVGRMQMKVPGLGAAFDLVLGRDAVYFRVPNVLGGGGVGGQWVRRPLADSTRAALLGSGAGPAGLSRMLDSVAGDVERLGADTVRGTPVEGFGFTVEGSELVGAGRETPEGLAGTDVPVEAWLDEDDRLRRIVARVDLGPAIDAARERMADSLGAGRRLGGMIGSLADTLSTTVELYDFGTAVEVQPPEGEDVMDVGEFRRRSNRAASSREGRPPGGR